MKRSGFKQKATKPLKRSSFKQKGTSKRVTRKKSSNGRVVRKSPILGINLNAKYPAYGDLPSGKKRYTGLKGIAWTICSLYIRKRDDYKCSTCHEENPETMQAGHYQPMGLVGSNNTLGWDEMNIHCQCKRCNENLGGLQEVMANYIRDKYGEEVRKEMEDRAHKVDPVENWEEMIIYYETKLEEL